MTDTAQTLTPEATPEVPVNEFGIPTDPATAVDWFKSGKLTVTENVDKVKSGPVREPYSITVKSKKTNEDGEVEEIVHYTTGKNEKGESIASQVFGWTKTDSLAGVFEMLDGEISDEQHEFINKALSGDKNGKANQRLIEIFNAYTRSNARQNDYQRVTNMHKPMDEEDKAKATERMINTFMQVFSVSREEARKRITGA